MIEGQKQERFAELFPLLILFIQATGHTVRIGDVWAKIGHIRNSYHYRKLAADLNVFKDGVYLDQTIQYEPFGTFWMSLDPMCVWGGDFGDGGHFSMWEGKE